MAEKYHRWTNDDIATFWRLKEEGYTLDKIAEVLGLSCASVRSKSKKLQKSSSVKTEQAGQNRTEPDRTRTSENEVKAMTPKEANDSDEIKSPDPMLGLTWQATRLQLAAGIKASHLLIDTEGEAWVITISGVDETNEPVELTMRRQKNPLPFRATMQNEQGTS